MNAPVTDGVEALIERVAALLKKQRANRYADEALAPDDLIDTEDAREIIEALAGPQIDQLWERLPVIPNRNEEGAYILTPNDGPRSITRDQLLEAFARPQPEGVEALVGLLRALAFDCDSTDGWQDAAPTVRKAADMIEVLARCGSIGRHE